MNVLFVTDVINIVDISVVDHCRIVVLTVTLDVNDFCFGVIVVVVGAVVALCSRSRGARPSVPSTRTRAKTEQRIVGRRRWCFLSRTRWAVWSKLCDCSR